MQQINEIITNGAVSILVILAGIAVKAVKDWVRSLFVASFRGEDMLEDTIFATDARNRCSRRRILIG